MGINARARWTPIRDRSPVWTAAALAAVVGWAGMAGFWVWVFSQPATLLSLPAFDLFGAVFSFGITVAIFGPLAAIAGHYFVFGSFAPA